MEEYFERGKAFNEFTDGELKDVQAFLMSTAGEYNCADTRNEAEVAGTVAIKPAGRKKVVYETVVGVQPPRWHDIRRKCWDFLAGVESPKYCCYLLDKDRTQIRKVPITFLKDSASDTEEPAPTMIRILQVCYVQVHVERLEPGSQLERLSLEEGQFQNASARVKKLAERADCIWVPL